MRRILVALIGIGFAVAAGAACSSTTDEAVGHPHYTFPAPWELVTASDLSLWTDDQVATYEARDWAESTEHVEGSWVGTMVPQGATTSYFYEVDRHVGEPWSADLSITVHARERRFDNTPEEPVEAFGLVGGFVEEGPSSRSTALWLESDDIIMRVVSTTLDREGVLDFLDHAALAGASPLDGFIVDDQVYGELSLPGLSGQVPVSYGGWAHPDLDGQQRAAVLVRHVPIDLFRAWTSTNQWGTVPEDMQSRVDRGDVILLSPSITYDAGDRLLIEHTEVDFEELESITRSEWAELAVPVNVRPEDAPFFPAWFFPYSDER